jgi:hypothetical protein
MANGDGTGLLARGRERDERDTGIDVGRAHGAGDERLIQTKPRREVQRQARAVNLPNQSGIKGAIPNGGPEQVLSFINA